MRYQVSPDDDDDDDAVAEAELSHRTMSLSLDPGTRSTLTLAGSIGSAQPTTANQVNK